MAGCYCFFSPFTLFFMYNFCLNSIISLFPKANEKLKQAAICVCLFHFSICLPTNRITGVAFVLYSDHALRVVRAANRLINSPIKLVVSFTTVRCCN